MHAAHDFFTRPALVDITSHDTDARRSAAAASPAAAAASAASVTHVRRRAEVECELKHRRHSNGHRSQTCQTCRHTIDRPVAATDIKLTTHRYVVVVIARKGALIDSLAIQVSIQDYATSRPRPLYRGSRH